MSVDYFDSRILTGTIINRPPQYNLLTQLFFTPQAPKNTDTFELHLQNKGQMLLPFVRNEEAGKVFTNGSGEVTVTKAPRIRMKTPYQAAEMLRNGIGYTPYETESNPVEKRIVEDMDWLRRNVDVTIEWMVAELITTGKVTVSDRVDGTSMPIYTLDNRMPSKHKVTLTGGNLWSASTSTLMDDVEEWSLLIQESCGLAPTDLILGKNVWKHFFKHADVRDGLDNRRITLGGLTPTVQQMFKGIWNGLNIWVYAGNVTDYSNKTKYFVDANSVLLGTRNADAVIEYGKPLDLKCEAPTSYFVKTYAEEDPSATWLLMESRPMPWARRSGAFLCASVCEG